MKKKKNRKKKKEKEDESRCEVYGDVIGAVGVH